MKYMMRSIAVAILVAIPLAAVYGQERSVEESYLQETQEDMIIREQSRADTREMKELALEYIGDAIQKGNTGPGVHQALEYLGLEGVLNRATENGRLINNFPTIRRDAARYLGELGTPEAKETLLKMIYNDNEPMVLQEVVKSLADIGNDDNGRTTETIAWILKKFDNTNPDNLLALVAIDAFDRLGEAKGGLRDPNAVQMLLRIADGNYIRPVQNKAKAVLIKIRQSSR
jgi:hypothetical protein